MIRYSNIMKEGRDEERKEEEGIHGKRGLRPLYRLLGQLIGRGEIILRIGIKADPKGREPWQKREYR